MITGIPGRVSVWSSSLDDEEDSMQAGGNSARGFIFSGGASSIGEEEEKLSEEEMGPLGDYTLVMQIFVKDLMGKTHCLSVNRCEQIALVKRKVYTKMVLRPSLQRLIYGGKQLENGFDLSFYGVRR